MAFTPTDVRLGGSFVQNLSSFQQNTNQLSKFFSEKRTEKNVSKALSEVNVFDEEGKPVLEQRGNFRTADS